MNKFITMLLTLLSLSLSGGAKSNNPMLWADYPDPDIIRVGDTYYLMTTTMFFMPGAPIMQSKDLVNWQLASYVFDRLDDSPKYDLREGTAYGRGQWATSLKYHNGKFYVLFAPNEAGPMGRTYIYTADSAVGPWTLVSRLPHFHDASLLFDEDGPGCTPDKCRIYVYYGTGEQVELTPDLQGMVEGSHRQTFQREADETGILEGSRVIKHRGRYYLLMISQVWAPGRNRRQVCYRADRPEGPYEKHIILESAFGGFPHVGQGTIVDTPDGDWYAVIFQDRGGVGRVPLLMPCRWIDGWPMLGDEEGHIPAWMRPQVSGQPRGIVTTSDEFSSQDLNPNWQWNHNPDNSAWTLSERPGWLRLKTSRIVPNLYLAPNTLTQRMEGPKSSATVTLDISHLKDGDRAGFAAFNGQSGVLAIKKNGKRLVLEMSEQQVNLSGQDKAVESVEEKVVKSVDLATRQSTIHLRIDTDFLPQRDIAHFSYSLDGTAWMPIGTAYKMRFDWQRLFVGTRFAIFCYATKRKGGYVDVEDFQYTRQEE